VAGDGPSVRGSSSWLTRAAFAVAVAGGLVLIVVPAARSAFSGARAGDDLVELASPVLSDEGLADLRHDFDVLDATGTALIEVGVPHLAEQTGQTPEELVAEIGRTDPAVATALADLPAVTDLGGRIVTNLERRQGEFDSAASLPGLGLTLEQGAWLLLGTGIVLAGLGVVGVARPRRSVVVAVGVVGALLVAGPLALGYPDKTSDTDALLDSLRPFSVAKVEQREVALATVQSVLDGMDRVILPTVAAHMGTSVAAVAADLGQVDPALAPQRFADARTILVGFADLVAFSRTIQPLLVEATNLPSTAFVWLTILPGAALVAAAGGALVFGAPRSRRRAAPEAERDVAAAVGGTSTIG
jgi:hypothetical protein